MDRSLLKYRVHLLSIFLPKYFLPRFEQMRCAEHWHTSCALLAIYGSLLSYVEYDSLASLAEILIGILFADSSIVVRRPARDRETVHAARP